MDITPILPEDALPIRNYGPEGFGLGERTYPGPVLITAQGVNEMALPRELEAIDIAPWLGALRNTGTEILLVGGGAILQRVPESWKFQLRPLGIASEAMDTGAACRTYNVLLGEGRHVAVLLLPL